MYRLKALLDASPVLDAHGLTLAALFGANLVFNVVANASFKVSASSTNWRAFLLWQVIGNLAGLITVLTLTALLRYIPLAVAYPVTVGLAVIGVQVVGALILFRETISLMQWVGTLLIVMGILLIGGR
jgi:multidrug transporter EmrE-like cation transporter